MHQALNAAKIDANRKSRHQLHKRTGCNWLRSDMFRADLGGHLAETLPDTWTLDAAEREQHRGALVLRSVDGYIAARIQRVDADGTLPGARSDRRRGFYRNCDIREIDLLGQCKHNLMLTYQEPEGDRPFIVRAIRPYRVPELMFSIVMPAVADDFLKGRFDIENDGSHQELFGDDTDFGTGTDS